MSVTVSRAVLTVVAVIAVAALLFLLFRELWRAFAPGLRRARDLRRRERHLAARAEETLRTPGATPADPVEVISASVVETRALADPCVVCGERTYAEAHVVERFGEETLRVVRLGCRRCGHRRPFYVRISDRPVLH